MDISKHRLRAADLALFPGEGGPYSSSMQPPRCFTWLRLGILSLSAISPVTAATTILKIDFGQTQTPSLVESGFDGFKVTNVGVAGPQTQTFGAYTVRIANGITVDAGGALNATGVVNARDRGAPATDAGVFTYNDVYRDFVTQGLDTGVQITGLSANTSHEVRFYTYDHSNARTQTFKNLTGGTTTTLGTFGWTAGATFDVATSNDIYSVAYTVTSDSQGRLTFDINNAAAVTTLLNGLVVTDLSVVPEPSTCAALAGGVVLAAAVLRRRRAP